MIRNVAVYSSGQGGVGLNRCQNCTAERVQVIPRPGTDRLIGSNADGITAIQVGQGNTIRLCRVKRTLDDSMSPNSQELAIIAGKPSGNTVTVTRSAYSTFANGLNVQFIDNTTGFPLVTAHLVSQDPPFVAQPDFGGTATLTFDQALPALTVGEPMVYADPADRGAGLLIEDNLIEENVFARGLSIWGILGGTVQGNVLRKVDWSAINPVQHLSTSDWMVGPNQNLNIRNNVIEQSNLGLGPSVAENFAGIDIESLDHSFALNTKSPFQNIDVTNNFLNISPYSGIRRAEREWRKRHRQPADGCVRAT